MRVGERRRVVRGDEAARGRLGDDRAGRGAKQAGMVARVRERQVLRDEFDVDQAARDQLEVPGVLVALLAGD